MGGSLEIFILARNFQSRAKSRMFLIFGPSGEVFGTDIPRTSGGHSRGYPGPKLRSGRSKSWKNEHFGVDIHDPKARTSTTLSGFQKLRSEKLWAEFSFPIHPLERNRVSEAQTTFDTLQGPGLGATGPLGGGGGVAATPLRHPRNCGKSRNLRGPKDQKNRDFERDWKFRARMKFSSEPPTAALFLWGNRDVEIELFERD